MKFLDKDFFKFTFQFLAILFCGIILISYISGLNLKDGTTAQVADN